MPVADLVLEGGGVKGAGLAGAVTALAEHSDPYTFHRIAGTSAGAIVASLLAAGATPSELKQTLVAQDFAQFEDETAVFTHLKLFGEGFGLLFHEGLFAGDVLHSFVAQQLAKHGVTTWADLKLEDDQLPPEQRYKLVVVVSDISRGRELRLPWDYRSELGVDPDTQPVADAVRASSSLPFFFRPFRLRADPAYSQKNGFVLCTDGGMLSNYPIDLFDRPAGARWPTIGIKLSAKKQISTTSWKPNANAIELATGLIATMADAHDALHVDDPYYSSRTIFVDTTGFSTTNFHLSDADKNTLFGNGLSAGQQFLAGWDYQKWLTTYTERAPAPAFRAAPPDQAGQ